MTDFDADPPEWSSHMVNYRRAPPSPDYPALHRGIVFGSMLMACAATLLWWWLR